jgi:hypothetical protein
MTHKKIDLGEYIIKIAYDKSTGKLDVVVYDELGGVIEGIYVITDEDENSPNVDNDTLNNFNPN